MSNNNIPMGLRPINQDGTAWNGQGRMVCFAANDSDDIFIGDPLLPTGATDDFGVPIVGLAVAGATNTVLGSLLGMCNGPAGSGVTLTRDNPVYRPGSILNYGLIVDGVDQLYTIQEDGLGGAIAAANGGYTNGNLIAGSGSTVTGFSGWQLDSSSVDGNANATYQLRILGLVRGPDNALGEFAKWIVRLNLPALSAAAGY